MQHDTLHDLLEPWLSGVDQCNGCLLVDLLTHLQMCGDSGNDTTSQQLQLAHTVETLLEHGYTLRHSFPHVPQSLQEEWLGRRFVLGHSRWFRRDGSGTSIVSSRLGRYGRLLADWPALLEVLMRSIRRTGTIYLAVPGTTIAPLVEPLLARSAVPYVQVRFPAVSDSDVAAWLAVKLQAVAERKDVGDQDLHLSPQRSKAMDAVERLPLQDRIAVCCAERVRALWVRPRGAIAHLLEQRLDDPRFCIGTVSVFLPSGSNRRARSTRAAQLAWLERGAVGWYVPPTARHAGQLGCRQRRASNSAPLWQLTSKLSLLASAPAASTADAPSYLVHCVRGSPGALPPDAAADWIASGWLTGQVPDDSPLGTLVQILAGGRLRGRSTLYRADWPCVSFSGVPLDELVRRRSFQPHLGRWDWEPFGLIIERQALEAVGARPVIYGDGDSYRQLSDADRPFFQPAKRRRGADFGRPEWKEECEWRVVGDVRLNELPRQAVRVFVAYPHQAQSLARHASWPVIWLQDAQTRVPPVGPARRPRKEARTGRS